MLKKTLLTQIRRHSSTKKYVLEYKYVPNMLERRVPYREAHLKYAEAFVQRKVLLAGGAVLPEVHKGLLVFEAEGRDVVETFAKNDPYVVHGLVTHFDIGEWAIAVGEI